MAANGARFHVALAGPEDPGAPLVVLLHGFPQFWWAWRHQITALAEAGHRVAAMDLRGFGASDRPPAGHTAPIMAADVAGVARGLGAEHTVVIGHGIGGSLAWAMGYLHPDLVSAIATLSAPHPLPLLRTPQRLPVRTATLAAAIQLPGWAERKLRDGELVTHVLTAGSAPGRVLPPEELDVYRDAVTSSAAQHQVEYLRWLARAARHMTARHYRARLTGALDIPVLALRGREDRLLPESYFSRNGERLGGGYDLRELSGGHFLPEESAEEVSAALIDFLRTHARG